MEPARPMPSRRTSRSALLAPDERKTRPYGRLSIRSLSKGRIGDVPRSSRHRPAAVPPTCSWTSCSSIRSLGISNAVEIVSQPAEEVDEPGDGTGPAGLVARAEPGAVVAVEVLVEEDQVTPVRILLERRASAVDRPSPVGVREEDADEAARDLLRHLEQRHPDARARRALDREARRRRTRRG